jgi:acyl-CoA synthetase (AMP-forming)/AMP-acid ligase II
VAPALNIVGAIRGLAEASPVTHYVHQDDENVHGTIGTLLPSTEARLVDPSTAEDAAAGRPGAARN